MNNRITALLSVAVLVCACGGNGGPTGAAGLNGSISVFAAASLTESAKALGTAFQAAHPGTTVQLNFAGSPTLVIRSRVSCWR